MAYERHEPAYYDTTSEWWDPPDCQAFDSSVAAVDSRFLLSASETRSARHEPFVMPVNEDRELETQQELETTEEDQPETGR